MHLFQLLSDETEMDYGFDQVSTSCMHPMLRPYSENSSLRTFRVMLDIGVENLLR